MSNFRTALITSTSLIALSFGAFSDDTIRYEMTFENAVHHEAEIKISMSNVTMGPLELRMSRSSPGRYAIHEFAKNVYNVRAVDGDGKPLRIDRKDPYSWFINDHNGVVNVTYTLYADRADGTYAQVDLRHAHLNMPATFIWARGYEDAPVEIEFKPSDETWKVATQLVPTENKYTFTAPNFQYFMDSPTLLSDFDLREWTVDDNGVERTIRLAVNHDGTEEDMDTYTAKAKAVVDAQIELFGDVPDFDYGTYTFIANYLPQVSGDGMEHRNSTVLTSSRGLYESDFSQLGTLSHEFIHAWNVERLRPMELEPFDFTATNPTPSLWLAEGFTSYYGPLTIKRAGEDTVSGYVRSLSRQLNGIWNAAGRGYASPQEMSLRAPFVDAATSIDPTNNRNIFTSYYPYGAIIGLALDLTIRAEYPGKSLDDVMRELWRTNGVTQQPYAPDAIVGAVEAVTGDRNFAETFYKNYVQSSALPGFGPLLEKAGMTFGPANPDKAYLGSLRLNSDGVIRDNIRVNTPLYGAGLERGDTIIKLGRFDITNQSSLTRAMGRHKAGDKVMITFKRRSGGEVMKEITFHEDPTHAIKLMDDISDEQQAFRDAWLGD